MFLCVPIYFPCPVCLLYIIQNYNRSLTIGILSLSHVNIFLKWSFE